ncbi:MAG: cache domain-containing protein [Betaproteobacteria bacterium]
MNIKLFVISAVIAATSIFANAAEPTKNDAVGLVKAAAEVVNKGGKDTLIAEVNAKSDKWTKGELYLIVLALDGTHLAHPGNPKLIGKSLLDLGDIDLRMFRRERVRIANGPGEGWVDYKYKNPKSGIVENKTLYVLKARDVILSAGIYK